MSAEAAGEGTRTDGRTARRVATRERVIAAGLELFAERGYSATSVEEIAEHAGVSKGTVFYNFGSKQGLGAAVVRESADRIAAVVEAARAPHRGWAALNAIVLALLRAFDADPATCQVLLTELFRNERPWHEDLPATRAALIAPVVAVSMEVHEQRYAAGLTHVRPEAEHFEMIAIAILGALAFSALDRATFHPRRSIEDVQRALMVTISGLAV
ncbi:TetR/AcrR family transcriptional regulator [Raineyella fluvialis]|uniref:TetR family transcriptional regulator n=1 Tax=Raineyella fluvialis TaxID=2662261 RepID=A0A5Q2FED8_9ACTN|nr:TetR/AcrR family transcriptional regulator [Raineyella fluvialis]QGF23085.1 TetR family transcriptional regulator [Raineyella fluvialis]